MNALRAEESKSGDQKVPMNYRRKYCSTICNSLNALSRNSPSGNSSTHARAPCWSCPAHWWRTDMALSVWASPAGKSFKIICTASAGDVSANTNAMRAINRSCWSTLECSFTQSAALFGSLAAHCCRRTPNNSPGCPANPYCSACSTPLRGSDLAIWKHRSVKTELRSSPSGSRSAHCCAPTKSRSAHSCATRRSISTRHLPDSRDSAKSAASDGAFPINSGSRSESTWSISPASPEIRAALILLTVTAISSFDFMFTDEDLNTLLFPAVLFFGKTLDTLDSDPLEFADGRGCENTNHPVKVTQMLIVRATTPCRKFIALTIDQHY
jgi:hypothetical protein